SDACLDRARPYQGLYHQCLELASAAEPRSFARGGGRLSSLRASSHRARRTPNLNPFGRSIGASLVGPAGRDHAAARQMADLPECERGPRHSGHADLASGLFAATAGGETPGMAGSPGGCGKIERSWTCFVRGLTAPSVIGKAGAHIESTCPY